MAKCNQLTLLSFKGLTDQTQQVAYNGLSSNFWLHRCQPSSVYSGTQESN